MKVTKREQMCDPICGACFKSAPNLSSYIKLLYKCKFIRSEVINQEMKSSN